MNDKRYRENDRDYIHFVQRQFRRVYDDPSGEPSKDLRIGRPQTFVSDLEHFDRAREQRLRRATEVQTSEGARARQLGAAGKLASDKLHQRRPQPIADSDIIAKDEHDIVPPEERAAGRLGPGDPGRGGPTPGIFGSGNEEAWQRYLDISEARTRSWLFQGLAGGVGYDEAVRAHQHYLDGSGEPLVVDAEIVRNYGPVNDAQQSMLGKLTEWFKGDRNDSIFGQPWFDLDDGERLVVGELSAGPSMLGKLARWEVTFEGPSDYDVGNQLSEGRTTLNGGTLESFSQLVFERNGDRIDVSGTMRLRVNDRYDFDAGHILRSKVLEDEARAKSYDISTTFWLRRVSGWIDLSDPDRPDAHLTYTD